MSKLLTIVIAAYNMEKLLPRCLESLIVSKELQNLVQILVVNDGSKDRTLEIAQGFEKKYPDFIYAINQKNGNYGKVMNHGLSLAEGKYFRTLDADDWYDNESFAKFLVDLQKTDADMIITQRSEYLENIKEISQVKKVFDPSVKTYTDLSISEVNWSNTTVIDNLNVPHITYRTSLLRESGLKWLEGICYTDTMYDYWPLRLVKKVRFVPLNVYTYLVGTNEQSMSPKNIRKNFNHFAKVAEAIGRDFKENGDASSCIFPVQNKFINQIMNFIYGDLVYGDENLDKIVELHNLYLQTPYYKKAFENRTFFRIKCFSKFHKGILPVRFKILRAINKLTGYKLKSL